MHARAAKRTTTVRKRLLKLPRIVLYLRVFIRSAVALLRLKEKRNRCTSHGRLFPDRIFHFRLFHQQRAGSCMYAAGGTFLYVHKYKYRLIININYKKSLCLS